MIKIRKHYQNLTNENIDRIIKDWQTEIEKIDTSMLAIHDVGEFGENLSPLERIAMYQRMILELRTVKERNQ